MAAEVGPGYIANVGPSPERERDHLPAAAVAAGHLVEDDPPDDCDLRAPWYRVGNQLKTGSCVGWALADSVMWRQLVRKGQLDEATRLSPRFMWMAAKELRTKKTEVSGAEDWRPSTFLEQGMVDVKSALDVARRYGAAREQDLEFSGHLYPGDPARFYDLAGRHKIVAYYRLDPADDPPEAWFAHWRRWIAQHGPVLVTLALDQAFEDGQVRLDAFTAPKVPEGHAAALVGYDDGWFVIRSSWSEKWGDAGYVKASEAWLQQATFESYGVVV